MPMAGGAMAGFRVRRDKAALFQRVQAPPGDRSSRKQPGRHGGDEMSEVPA